MSSSSNSGGGWALLLFLCIAFGISPFHILFFLLLLGVIAACGS